MSCFCQNQKQRVLKFQIHSWPFCPRELILFPLLNCIFCTFFPVSDSSSSETILLTSDTLPLVVTGVLLSCSQAAQASSSLHKTVLSSPSYRARLLFSYCLLPLLPFPLLKTAHKLTHTQLSSSVTLLTFLSLLPFLDLPVHHTSYHHTSAFLLWYSHRP